MALYLASSRHGRHIHYITIIRSGAAACLLRSPTTTRGGSAASGTSTLLGGRSLGGCGIRGTPEGLSELGDHGLHANHIAHCTVSHTATQLHSYTATQPQPQPQPHTATHSHTATAT